MRHKKAEVLAELVASGGDRTRVSCNSGKRALSTTSVLPSPSYDGSYLSFLVTTATVVIEVAAVRHLKIAFALEKVSEMIQQVVKSEG